MGQKVNPIGLRIGIVKDWPSKWFSSRHYTEWVLEDIKIRDHIKSRFKQAGIPRVEIEERQTPLSSQFTLLVQVC
jgi:SSU ribosomal protein S3P